MLNAERLTGPQQEQDGTNARGFISRHRTLTDAHQETRSTDCREFENWSREMQMGSFEAAWRINDRCGSHWPSAHRLWDGRSLRGTNLIVHAKHGLGDAVQMLQYAQRLRALSSHIRFEVPADLAALMPYFQGVQPASSDRSSLSEARLARDVEVEMMELPYLFRTRLEDLPLKTNYLVLPEATSTHYLACMGQTRKPRIGVVWAGGEWDRDRWIPLDLLSPLVADDAYEWWNLQGGLRAREGSQFPLKNIVKSSDAGLVSLAATISNLDLVLTVDTLAAHLSAALGRPTWLMLKHDADWRWLSNRNDSPWYPCVRLFRQSSPGNWSGVVASIQRALEANFIRCSLNRA